MADNIVKVRFYGVLGQEFGKEFNLAVKSVGEAIHAINILKKRKLYTWLAEHDKKGQTYKVLINNKPFRTSEDLSRIENVSNTELVINNENLKTVDVVPVIEGADGDIQAIFTIVLGVILIAVGFWSGVGPVIGTALVVAGLGLIAGGVINFLMKPPQFEDFREIAGGGRTSYLFNGPQNTTREGGPVPIVYGHLVVGSQVISASYNIQYVSANLDLREIQPQYLTNGPGGVEGSAVDGTVNPTNPTSSTITSAGRYINSIKVTKTYAIAIHSNGKIITATLSKLGLGHPYQFFTSALVPVLINEDFSISTTFNTARDFFSPYSGLEDFYIQSISHRNRLDDGLPEKTAFGGWIRWYKPTYGGRFGAYGYTEFKGVIFLDSNGVIENGFNTASGIVDALYIQSDGKTLYSSGATVARIDTNNTSADGTFSTATINNTVRTIELDSSGNVFIGGDFTDIGGSTRNKAAKLNSSGTLDGSFNPNVAGGNIYDIKMDASTGKFYIAGSFTSVGSDAAYKYICRLNADGTADSTFVSPTISGGSTIIHTIAIQGNDGKVVCGGDFTSVTDGTSTVTNKMFRLSNTGVLDASYATATHIDNGVIRKILIRDSSTRAIDDGKTFVIGTFTSYFDTSISRRVNTGGLLRLGSYYVEEETE